MSEISREQRLEIIKEWHNETMSTCIGKDCNECKFKTEKAVDDTYCLLKRKDITEAFNVTYPRKKTYKEDFLEKFPNAGVAKHGRPVACRDNIYRENRCNDYRSCDKCWNQEMEE